MYSRYGRNGSGTGRNRDRQGAYRATRKCEGGFALADGGTLFLDEIGELSADLHAKLLRVLQEGKFEPVGSSQPRKVDVRVISATHRDSHHAVAEDRFREDLFHGVNVFPIGLPPLRERAEDIALLVDSRPHSAARARCLPTDKFSRPGITIPRTALLVAVTLSVVLWAGIIGGLMLVAHLF